MNLTESILRHAAQHPDKIAISSSCIQLPYSTLVQSMKKIAQGLRQKGLYHDYIGILCTNRPEFAEVFTGAVYAGCIPIPLDPKWSPEELNAVLHRCRPKLLFTETGFLDEPSIRGMGIEIIAFAEGESESAVSYNQWLETLTPNADIDHTQELLFIGFTSGTTGVPKGYMRTHRSWINSFKAADLHLKLEPFEHVMAPGPFVHSLSLFALIQSLYCGATFHLLERFCAEETIRLCEEIPEMHLFAVPTMIDSLITRAESESRRIKLSAVISSGGTWTEISKTKAVDIFEGAKLIETYGSSEASYISYLNIKEDRKEGSLGKPFSGVRISIRDEQFREVPTGEVGQLWIRSNMVFAGYYQMPEFTATVFREGWLRLGDCMYVDEEGYLHMAGRTDNMIVSGGLNIYPEEVEAVLRKHPSIEEVMVLGLPDPYWEQAVTAIVKWKGHESVSLEEVKRYCRLHLASYKAPKRLVAVERFLYTGSGKIARKAMKDSLLGG